MKGRGLMRVIAGVASGLGMAWMLLVLTLLAVTAGFLVQDVRVMGSDLALVIICLVAAFVAALVAIGVCGRGLHSAMRGMGHPAIRIFMVTMSMVLVGGVLLWMYHPGKQIGSCIVELSGPPIENACLDHPDGPLVGILPVAADGLHRLLVQVVGVVIVVMIVALIATTLIASRRDDGSALGVDEVALRRSTMLHHGIDPDGRSEVLRRLVDLGVPRSRIAPVSNEEAVVEFHDDHDQWWLIDLRPANDTVDTAMVTRRWSAVVDTMISCRSMREAGLLTTDQQSFAVFAKKKSMSAAGAVQEEGTA